MKDTSKDITHFQNATHIRKSVFIVLIKIFVVRDRMSDGMSK